jgi:hypothetical protein
MTVYEITTLFIAVGDGIDGLWNMFLTLHAAAFGTIFYLSTTPARETILVRLCGTLLYSFFVFINGRAMLDSYKLIVALNEDLTNMLTTNQNVAPNLSLFIGQITYSDRHLMVYTVHGVAALIVIAGLWISSKKTNNHVTGGSASGDTTCGGASCG